jgi:hypothetical protein
MRQAVLICPAGVAMPDTGEPVGFAWMHDTPADVGSSGAGHRLLARLCGLGPRIPVFSFPPPDMSGRLTF